MIQAMAETRALFSANSQQTTNREKRICRAFLRCIGVGYSEADLVAGQYEPIDVAVLGAKFQVTEVLGDRRRGDELRELETKYKTACSSADLLVSIGAPKRISFAEIATEVRKRLEAKFINYTEHGCRGIDALVHIELVNRYLWPTEITFTEDIGILRAEGWRSVSVLIVPYAFVLFTTDTAPTFLKDHAGQLHCVDADMINRLFDE